MVPPIIARGSLGGRALRSFDAGGFIFTETRHRPMLALPRHANDRATVVAILGGDYEETLGHGAWHHAPGSLIVRPPGEVHSNAIGPRGAACLLVELTADRFDRVREHHGVFDRPRAVPPGVASVVAARAGARREPAWLPVVRAMLDDHAEEPPPPLARLARAAGLHPVYLARAFRSRLGCSVGEYSRRRRVAWACERLASSAATMAEIAAGAGFHDQSHFSRVFRRYTAMTPAAFRRSVRGGSGDAGRVRDVLDARLDVRRS